MRLPELLSRGGGVFRPNSASRILEGWRVFWGLVERRSFTTASYLKKPVEFVRLGEPMFLRAIELHLECKRFWLVQTIREDVSHGLYDHLKQVLLIPDKEAWSLQFDSRNWREITPADELEPHERSPGTLRLNMVLFNPIFGNVHGPAPSLDEFIDKEETVVERATSCS